MRPLSALLALFGLAAAAPAAGSHAPRPLDFEAIRFALAQVESGDNPTARGAAGELGRFQILPEVARQYGGHDWEAARRILRDRLTLLPRKHPTPQEVYLVWHRPGLFARLNWKYEQLPEIVRARADRFANLYASHLRKPAAHD